MPSFKVKAVYEYSSPHEDDLNFPAGQVITVTEEEGDDWYVGEYIDDAGSKKDGLFPRNFVEKYEPPVPSRPNRASRHQPLEQPAAPPEPPVPAVPPQEAADSEPEEPEPEPEPPKPQPAPVVVPPAAKSALSPTSPPSATSARSQDTPQEAPAAPKPAPAQPAAPAAKKPPPPIAAKSNAFRDRIAAFNQPAAAPIAPFKPGGGAPQTFIKKPFVAPPPSRNAYVPPPREAPQVKTYRREEDPEIADRQAQDQENAERAGLVTHGSIETAEEGEDQPKPTSLKERIALLQKQQEEQAQRQAALHKEKPKKPPSKKRTDSYEGRAHEEEGAALDHTATNESRERSSIDHARPPRSSHGVKSPDVHSQQREFLSDANDADQSGAGDTEDAEGTSTSVEDDEDRVKHRVEPLRAPAAPPREPDVGDEEDPEEGEEEEDELDPEERRKLELRERMAKMSGGFGMAGMLGGPPGFGLGGLPPKKKKPAEKKSTGDSEEYAIPQQRVPMFGLPGVKSPEAENKQLEVQREEETAPVTHGRSAHDVPDVEDVTPHPPQRTPTGEHPPPISAETRPLPPVRSPSPGSESGDELTDAQAPPSATSPRTPSGFGPSKRSSYPASDELSQDSPEKRVPPIPIASPTLGPGSPTASRPPPPPPPTGAPPSRQGTFDSVKKLKGIDRLEGESEYEGDYDTDIASGATHKDALKSHGHESSQDGSTTADETPVRSPITPSGAPPLPPIATRAVPPPPPQQPPRSSIDTPRGAPPPPPVPPPTRDLEDDDDDYDPYRYTTSTRVGAPPPPPPPTAPRAAPPPPQSQPPVPQHRPPPPAAPPIPAIPPVPQHQAEESSDEDDLYAAPPPRKSHDRPPPPPPQAPPHQAPLPHRPPPPQERAVPPPPPQERAAPPPPPQERAAPPPPPPEPSQSQRAPAGRKSLDVNRALPGRASMDQSRPSQSLEFIASDVDLGASSHWWTQPNMPPPSLNGRKDILLELDESRSGNSIEKAVYVLYIDYSQTIITARFQTSNVSDVQLEQRHEPPPARLRQDQLENAHEQFGLRIAKDVESKQNTVVGDGTPHSLITELLRPYPAALLPISTRSFGALVYANLANASTQQYDEIRPGDIVTFRNAKFQGKHGAMHAKYSVDVGKPDHVGVVVEWDGSKKKVRAWEQGRESKKVKPESFRMGDLRSGEVRVWRVMGKGWVGWN